MFHNFAADTSSIMMGWWMLAMLAYPETQARAQAVLDSVVGPARFQPSLLSTPTVHVPW